MADRGSENSRIYKTNGLTYWLMDTKGNKAGVPIKASDFYNKPTLRFLNERFVLNEKERQPHKVRVKDTIDLLLIKNSAMNLEGLIKALEKESIQTVLRQNNQIKSKKNENQIINVYSFQLKSFTFYCLHKHWLFEPLSMQGTIICYRQMEGGIG